MIVHLLTLSISLSLYLCLCLSVCLTFSLSLYLSLSLSPSLSLSLSNFTTLFFQWDFFHGKFGLPFPGKASCKRVALPNLGCMLGVLVFP